jgi:hypothetical protein
MPQSWQAHWPIDDPDDAAAVQRRNAHVNLLGNLTLVTGPLNASMSNAPWGSKREALEDHSLLLLNRDLVKQAAWDEASIHARGAALVDALLGIWRGPQHFMPEGWKLVEAESWAEDAEMPLDDVIAVYDAAGAHFRTMLEHLGAEPGRRWRFADLEAELGWPRGRIAGISGGYGQGLKKKLGGKRPWHVHLTSGGVWELWMDDQRAAAIRARQQT